MDVDLFARLERTGHILTAANAAAVFDAQQTWHENTFAGPQAHIITVTKRCNLDCSYCHMVPERVSSDPQQFDLQPEVADKIVDFILGTPNASLSILFQGGEPFLNFPVMQRIVERGRESARQCGKRVGFAITSNLMVAKDWQLEWCLTERVPVSYTLNGPGPIHDRYRLTRSGKGSFQRTLACLERIRSKFPGLVAASPLCVVGRETPEEVIAMLDFFHDMGFDDVAMIPLQQLGNARRRDIGYDFDRFMTAYLGGLDHLLAKNRASSSRVYTERLVTIALQKVLGARDPMYADWRNPTGAVSTVLAYDYDGEILPQDEARSVRQEFTLGNVRTTTWDDVVQSDEAFRVANLSLRDRDPQCRQCAYNPYCGVAPVVDFARTGSATPRPHESDECRFILAFFDWLLPRYLEDPVTLVRMLPAGADVIAALLQRTASASGGPSEC